MLDLWMNMNEQDEVSYRADGDNCSVELILDESERLEVIIKDNSGNELTFTATVKKGVLNFHDEMSSFSRMWGEVNREN